MELTVDEVKVAPAGGANAQGRLAIAVIYALAILCGAALISNGIENGMIKQNIADDSEVNRWSVYNQYSGGFNVFDSKTGNICSIPTGNIPGDRINCSKISSY